MPTGIRLDNRTVSGRITRHLWQTLLAHGIGTAEFTGQTGVTLAELESPDARISADKHRRCVELIGRFNFRPTLLENGLQFLFNDFPSLANLCVNSPNLRTALHHLLEFRGLIGEFDYMLLKENGDQVQLEYIAEFAPGNGAMQALANFSNAALITRCYDTGATPAVFQAEFMGAKPGFANEISAFFGQQARFGAARNTLTFSAARLDAPFPHYNPTLAPFLAQHARNDLSAIRQTSCFSATVERLIQSLLGASAEQPDAGSLLQTLCRELNTTRWTLHRQLQQEGTSFKELELRIKISESCRLLRDTQLSVAEISEQLGFSSQSAFTRFFKARQDLPPASYRQSLIHSAR